MEEGKVLIKNKGKSIDLDISWDLDFYKHAVLWMVRYGDLGYPRYGSTNVLCIMPRSAICIQQDECLKNDDVVFIDPGEEKKTWMNFKVNDRSES